MGKKLSMRIFMVTIIAILTIALIGCSNKSSTTGSSSTGSSSSTSGTSASSGSSSSGGTSSNNESAAQEEDYSDYPNRPITLIINYGPGGGTDLTTRTLAQKMEQILGQPIVIQNVEGGGGTVGLSQLKNAAPDGYTIGTGTGSNLTIAPYTVNNLPYNPWEDFTWIGGHGEFLYGLWAHKNTGIETVEQLIQYALDNPGKLIYAGSGEINELLVEQIPLAMGIEVKWNYLPQNSAAETVLAMLRGEAQFSTSSIGPIRPHIEEFNLLASLADARIPDVPDVPSIVELGIVKEPLSNTLGILAPKGVPEPIRQKLENAMREAMEDPETLENMRKTMEYVPFKTGEGFYNASYMTYEKIGELVKTGILD